MMHLLAQAVEPVLLDTPDVDWLALLPLLVLVGAGVLMLTVMSVVPFELPKNFPTVWTVLAGLGTIAAALVVWHRRLFTDDGYEPTSTLAGAFGVDGFSIFLTIVISCAVILASLLADDFTRREDLPAAEYNVLLMLSASGGIIMASANDLIVLFVGLEILSIAVYILAAIQTRRFQSQEAGLKYFVLGALASAFFLYGIALTYGAVGSTNLIEIQGFLSANLLLDNGLLLAGFALLLVGLGFKVAAVPFHSWTPDVYQGAPTPVVAFMASAVKAAGFAAIIRVFVVTFGAYRTDWQPLIYGLAVATLLVGSLLAITQTDVKRMLAYSSISHAGYLLVGIQAATSEGTAAVLFYLAAYTFMVIGSFAVITVVSRDGDRLTTLDDIKGLGSSRPVLAAALTVFLLGQAGVPFTTGFFAKFYVIKAAVEANSYWLGIVAMLAAVIAAFMYLRIIMGMWVDRPAGADDEGELFEDRTGLPIPWGIGVVLLITTGVTIAFGIAPGWIIDWARDATPVLVSAG